MWEHRSISNTEMRKSKTIAPSETYVRLMDAIQDSIKEAESKELDFERFLKHIPMEGPWARLDGNDEAKDNPIERYVGPGKARLMNTNLFLGSSWIDTQRFKFERRIDTPADFIRQKTVVNANMWTPKQVSTTQTLFFCSTGDEDRLGGSILSSNGKPKNNISDQHPFLGKGDSAYAEWEPILWGLGHRGVVPGSDPQDKVYYPSLMHRGVTFNNRLGWTRYSPAGFGKDASGYMMTRPYSWIWPAVDGNRENATAFNLLVNMPDRRASFGEDGITDVYITTGKTSLYTMMGMMRSATVRQMFGGGSELVPLEFHLVEPGIDEWIRGASDEDKYARLFEVTAALGYYLTSNETGTLGGGGKRRRLVVYPDDQGNLLTCVNASQVADHALKTNFTASLFTKLDQADFMNRVARRFTAYADLVARSESSRGAKWISSASVNGESVQGPNVHTILAVRGYDIMTMSEYMDTFNDVSAAPERIIRRCIQSIGTNALKTLYRLDDLGEIPGQSPFKHIFAPEDGKPFVYFTDLRFLVPNSIDQMRTLVGSKGADRGRMRDAFAEMTGADPLTALSISDICLPFLADMGEDTWQTGTGLNTDEIIVEVTMAVDPARVWKSMLEPTLDEVFDMPKGGKGTAANIWGDVFIQNEALHDRMRKDGQGEFLKILQLAYNWSNDHSRKRHKDAF